MPPAARNPFVKGFLDNRGELQIVLLHNPYGEIVNHPFFKVFAPKSKKWQSDSEMVKGGMFEFTFSSSLQDNSQMAAGENNGILSPGHPLILVYLL
jgi:hypothetical protein